MSSNTQPVYRIQANIDRLTGGWLSTSARPILGSPIVGSFIRFTGEWSILAVAAACVNVPLRSKQLNSSR